MLRFALAFAWAAALAGCAGAPPGGHAPEALALRGIMRDMGRDLNALVDGLMRDDYSVVERSAARLAGHPQPPVEERVRIITWLGADAGRFRGYDEQVHAHSQAVAKAARERQPHAALEALARVQSACMGCHMEFRKPLLERFYPSGS